MKIICKMTINLRPNEDDWKMPFLENIVLHDFEDDFVVPIVINEFTTCLKSILIYKSKKDKIKDQIFKNDILE